MAENQYQEKEAAEKKAHHEQQNNISKADYCEKLQKQERQQNNTTNLLKDKTSAQKYVLGENISK